MIKYGEPVWHNSELSNKEYTAIYYGVLLFFPVPQRTHYNTVKVDY